MSSNIIYTKPICACIICKKEFSVRGIHIHYERAHGTPEQKQKYSSGNHGRYADESYRQRRKSPRHTITDTCKHCGNAFSYEKIVTHAEKKGCSKSCITSLNNKERIANGFIQTRHTSEERKRASERSIALWQNPEYAKKVMSQSKRFTSKNEVLIRDHFINTHLEDEWTFGGGLKHNGETIVRDLFSKKLKICFEYDGIWHFKEVHGQLARKQLKDKLLEEWCIENEYSLIRLDENKFNSSSIAELTKIFYSLSKPTILKIGDRY